MKGRIQRSAASVNTSGKPFPPPFLSRHLADVADPSPHKEGVDLFALAGVNLKVVEEGVEERDHQVHQGHNEGNQECFSLLEWSPARIIRCILRQGEGRSAIDGLL